MNSDTHGGDVPSVEWGGVDNAWGVRVAEHVAVRWLCVSLCLHQVKACLVRSVNVALFYILRKKVSFFHICHIFNVYVCVCLSVHACVCMCLHLTMYSSPCVSNIHMQTL